MLFSFYVMKDRLNKIHNIKKNIKDNQEDLDIEKGKLNGLIYDFKLAIKETYYLLNNYDILDYDHYLSNFLKDANNCKSGITFKELIDNYYNILSKIDFTYYSYGRDYIYRGLNKNIILTFANLINNNNRNFTVFDSSCKRGELLSAIKEIKNKAVLYGLEESNSKAEEAKTVADKIIKGKVKGSRISNDTFDVVICNPDILSDLEDNMMAGAISKPERSYIFSNLNYLRSDGIFILGIPFYRLYKDFCLMIARQLKNVSIIKGIGEDYDKGLVYIIGQKDNTKTLDNDIYELLRRSYNYDKIPTLEEVELKNFTLPSQYKNVDLFRGSVIDIDELLNIVKTSGCKEDFFKKQEVNKINDNIIQPLLPFNIGQIGLVLTSGCLDGIIDEGDGHYHLVKGRVSKKKDIERSYDNGTVNEVETISNKVEINVILPSGDFKTLT